VGKNKIACISPHANNALRAAEQRGQYIKRTHSPAQAIGYTAIIFSKSPQPKTHA